MMVKVPINTMSYNNVLYIGDDAAVCIRLIEKFTGQLNIIQENYAELINNKKGKTGGYKLRNQIQFHFEGGVAVFKFKNEEQLPYIVRRQCVIACRNIAFEQMFFVA